MPPERSSGSWRRNRRRRSELGRRSPWCTAPPNRRSDREAPGPELAAPGPVRATAACRPPPPLSSVTSPPAGHSNAGSWELLRTGNCITTVDVFLGWTATGSRPGVLVRSGKGGPMSPHDGCAPGSGGHLNDLLSALLDGELPSDVRPEPALHLERCALCQEEFREAAAARTAVRDLPVHACQRWESLLEGVRREPSDHRRRRAWAVVSAAAAVAALRLPTGAPRVAPDLPGLVASHVARASLNGDPVTQLAPIAVPGYVGR
jgi:hypothetical protein